MSSRVLLPFVALVLAVSTAMLARDLFEAAPPPVQASPAPEPPAKLVLVAAADVPPGSFLKPEMVRWQPWPDVSVPESYYVKAETSEDEIVGSVARQLVPAGAPITRGGLVRPGDRGFLAAVLGQGMRAISIPVDEASSNAGLIFPGDHVDVILTQALRRDGDGDGMRRASETVVEDVRVLAMGQRLGPAEEDEPASGPVRTVTLEVTPQGAERIALATELGRVSLSLRSIVREAGDAGEEASSGPTWDHEVSRAIRPHAGESAAVLVLRGGSKGSKTQ